jgi:hypothetical protein
LNKGRSVNENIRAIFQPWDDFDPELCTCAEKNGCVELTCRARNGRGAAFVLQRDGGLAGRPRAVEMPPAELLA